MTATSDCARSAPLRSSESDHIKKEVIGELIPHERWPGATMVPNSEMMIDFENKQLFHILQSAKQILNTEVDISNCATESKGNSRLRAMQCQNQKVNQMKCFRNSSTPVLKNELI